ncbi:MAG: ribbon-helix-helix protein, CopG family [Lacisediminihabitans sp.]
MRTTVNLDADVVAAVENLRKQAGLGMSEAVNRLARQGLAMQRTSTARFVQRTAPLGIRINVDNTAEVLELLDEDDRTRS